MNELKPGWKWVKLEDVATQYSKRVPDPASSPYTRFVSSEHIGRFEPAVRAWGSSSDITSSKKAFETSDYLFVGRSLYGSDFRERAARVSFDGVSSNGIIAIREKHSTVADGFLGAILNHPRIWQYVVKNATGTLTRYIYWKTLKNYEFALPPLEEQRRITRCLSAANDVAESCVDALTGLDRAKDAAIAKAMEDGLRGTQLLPTSLGLRPANWDTCPLDDRYDVQLGKMLSRKTRGPGIKRPYLRNANINWGSLSLDDVLEMSLTENELERYELRPGDILACEGRHVGKSAIWRGQIDGACYQKALHRLRSRTERDVPEFMLHALRYYSVSGRLVRHTTGTTIPHLPLGNLRAIKVAFPPRDEQEEIVEFIEQFDAARRALKRQLRDARDVARAVCRSLEGSP